VRTRCNDPSRAIQLHNPTTGGKQPCNARSNMTGYNETTGQQDNQTTKQPKSKHSIRKKKVFHFFSASGRYRGPRGTGCDRCAPPFLSSFHSFQPRNSSRPAQSLLSVSTSILLPLQARPRAVGPPPSSPPLPPLPPPPPRSKGLLVGFSVGDSRGDSLIMGFSVGWVGGTYGRQTTEVTEIKTRPDGGKH
jgi:hypothetical protein